MRKIVEVAKREYIENAKTKTFLINIFLTPVLMGGILLFTGVMQRKTMEGPRPAKKLAIIDLSNDLSSDLERAFEQYNKSNAKRQITIDLRDVDTTELDAQLQTLKAKVKEGEYDACLVIAEEVVAGDGKSQYYTKKVTDFELYSTVQRVVYDTVVNKRLRLHDLSPELIKDLRRGVSVDQVDLMSKTETAGNPMVRLMVPFFFLFMMFMGVLGSSQGMLTTIIEEKTSRIVEVLLSALTPFQIMAGKIIGLAGLGLSVMAVWGTVAILSARVVGLDELVNAQGVALFLAYFVMGFVLIASIFGAIGSACNTFRDAQPLVTPVMMILILPMIMWFHIAQHPNGTIAIVTSFIPPVTPMIMILRLAAAPDIPVVQIVASLVLLGISVPVVMWASAKIFRTGVLMYGKPPSPFELLRWLRYK